MAPLAVVPLVGLPVIIAALLSFLLTAVVLVVRR